MPGKIKSMLPVALRRSIRAAIAFPRYLGGLLNCYFYDMRRYYNAASKGNESVCAGKIRYTELRSWINADTHKIEKALSLHDPRPGFGKAVVKRLLENLAEYNKTFGMDWSAQVAINVLNAYCKFNEQNDSPVDHIRQQLKQIVPSCSTSLEGGGVLSIERDAIQKQACLKGIETFFSSRYSIRDFAQEPIDTELIKCAITIAQKTPSVCNRQSWKAHVYTEKEAKNKIFEIQQGNRGFGNLAGGVIIITSDLATFFSYGERNQAWIDGGMFAMSLVYGLHAVGLGSCCLNWSAEPSRDRKLRKLVGIADNEVIIMLIAIGHLPETLRVAQSFRKPIDEVLITGHLQD